MDAAHEAPTRERLADAVRAVRDELLSEDCETVLDINDGSCADLAARVLDRLGIPQSERYMDFETGNLCWDDGGDDRFDRALIAEHWKGIVPPSPLSWDDVDDLGLPWTAHVWLVLDGRFHDADVPDGVDNLFDLPIFRRNLVGGMRRSRPDVLESLRGEPWWDASIAMHDEILAWRQAREAAASPGMR